MHFPSSHRWTMCITSNFLSPLKGGSKREFLHICVTFHGWTERVGMDIERGREKQGWTWHNVWNFNPLIYVYMATSLIPSKTVFADLNWTLLSIFVHDGKTGGDIIASTLHCCTASQPTFGIFIVFEGRFGTGVTFSALPKWYFMIVVLLFYTVGYVVRRVNNLMMLTTT